jgi:hypothetical protein
MVMVKVLGIIFFLLCTALPAGAENALDNYRLTPVREPEVLRMKAMKVRMRRTLEVKDIPNWKPTVCDYWDTTYYTYTSTTIKSLYIAFNPITINDQYNVRSCTDDPGPKTGYPSDHKWTHQDTILALQERQEPKPYYPEPSDSIISVYDLEGYLLSRVNKIKSGGNAPKAEYYYLDNRKRCISYSKYEFFGLKDSTRLFYDTSGKLIKWIKLSQQSVPFGGVEIRNSHFVWDTTSIRFVYDDHNDCIDVFETNTEYRTKKDSAGKRSLNLLSWTTHTSQIFDLSHRRIGFVSYSKDGKPDTAQRWSYVDSGGFVYQYATAPWLKKPQVQADSLILDAHGQNTGYVRRRWYNGSVITTTYIADKRVSEVVASMDRGRVERKYELVSDPSGNALHEISEYVSGGNFSPTKDTIEYTYDMNGLKTEGYYSYIDNRHQLFKRHLKYFYIYR